MKRIILKPGEEDRIRAGHPWVYDNEVEKILRGPGDKASGTELEAGETADVESSRKHYMGRAFVNPHSKIIARIYSPSKEGLDKGFFKRRIREAVLRRTGFDLARESARIVFGEADFLPGLIIDRFAGWPLEDIENSPAIPAAAGNAVNGAADSAEDGGPAENRRPLVFESVHEALGPPRFWLSVQFLAWGMDQRREEILAALDEALEKNEGIVEKSAAKVRELEGLPPREGIIAGTFPERGIVIFENGLPFAVNLLEGQKTGHFLDQRENRRTAALYAETLCRAPHEHGLRILDACSYTGGFGIHAARAALAAGENKVSLRALDASGGALETLRLNARLNGIVDLVIPAEGDIFEALREYERKKEMFDLVILDPPAFAKTRSALEGALRGYKEINLRAVKLLSRGGILVSCSCSQALDESRFRRMIAAAAADSERRLVQLDFRFQGADHPVLVGYDESCYLKCGIYRAL